MLERARRLYPEKEAVVCDGTRLTYAELHERCRKIAAYLRDMGIGRGDVVSILLFNCHHFLEAYFATSYLGAILNPINTRLLGTEISAILRDARSRMLITERRYTGELEKVVDSLPPIIWIEEDPARSFEGFLEEPERGIREDDVAHLYYTSGTTGKPKGVMLTHKNVTTHALCAICEFKIDDSDVWLHAAPLFHLADAWATFSFTFVGATHVMIRDFIVEDVLRLIEREGVTITNMVPTMLNMIVSHKGLERYDLSSMRVVLSGGAPCPPKLAKRVMEVFRCEYVQTYGMTETSPFLTASILKAHLRSVPEEERFRYRTKTGREFLGVELKVVREDGSAVKRDGKEVGEIVVRGDTVTPGYFGLEEETRRTIRDGWLYTGDLATIDEEGYVQIVDRRKDMIITGGENVYSFEVETVIYEHPSVLEVACVGLPDEKWGEMVTAFVVLKEGEKVEEGEIVSFVKERLAHFKAPKRVIFVPSLPKTGSGKISKAELRRIYGRRDDKSVQS
jgi:acyl-CoA synthetase (AMP-forming)/AMP-acid ligase II